MATEGGRPPRIPMTSGTYLEVRKIGRWRHRIVAVVRMHPTRGIVYRPLMVVWGRRRAINRAMRMEARADANAERAWAAL